MGRLHRLLEPTGCARPVSATRARLRARHVFSVKRKGHPDFCEAEGAPAFLAERHLPRSNGSACIGQRNATRAFYGGQCPRWLNGVEDEHEYGGQYILKAREGLCHAISLATDTLARGECLRMSAGHGAIASAA